MISHKKYSNNEMTIHDEVKRSILLLRKESLPNERLPANSCVILKIGSM
ncbi:hypothetical protein B4144_2572 [Bacillus atrophaeus]|nr:hypothetical protein B4144_2572 [Bacillus atrophaeus]